MRKAFGWLLYVGLLMILLMGIFYMAANPAEVDDPSPSSS